MTRRTANDRAEGSGRGHEGKAPGAYRMTRRQSRDAAMAPVQRGIWVASRQRPDDDPYLVFDFSRIRGELDLDVLRECFAGLSRRHEALRVAVADGDMPVQLVGDSGADMQFVDLSGRPDPEAAATRVAQEESRRPFDLTDHPLWRVKVLRLGDDEHLLLLTMHHLICDEWSLRLIHRELAADYAARTDGSASPPSPAELGYGDFAEWQAARFGSTAGERSLAHWRRALSEIPRELDLPADYPRVGNVTHERRRVDWIPTAKESREFTDLAERLGASPFILMVTLFGTVLARHCGQPDLALGTAMSGRTSRQTERMVGHFVNLLPVPVRLRDDPTLAEAVGRTRLEFLGLLDNQDIAFDDLVTELEAGRSDLRMPLCQANVSWSEGGDETWSLGRARVEPLAGPRGWAKSEIMLAGGARRGGGLEFELIGEAGFFRPETLRTLMDHFREAAAAAAEDPYQAVSDLDLASEEEQGRLARWGGSGHRDGSRTTIPRLFARAALEHADRIAVRGEDATLTYAELDERSEAWASELRRRGVSTDSVVGVAIPRSAEAVAAIIGILKAGGAYMALAPDGPADYNAFCVGDGRAVAVVATDATTGVLGDIDCEVVLSEDLRQGPPEPTDEPSSRGGDRCAPDSLAFVCFTSGSTGKPKCVGITHQNIARVAYRSARIAHGPGKTFAQLASLGFDISAMELWACLLHGGRLAVPSQRRLDIPELASILRDEAVTTFVTTTALFNQFVEQDIDALEGLEQILIGGETAVPSVFDKAVSAERTREVGLLHCYGPTENTCVSTSTVIAERVGAVVPIGTPIEGSTAYVLDSSLDRVPVGVVGELYTGGVGVSRGYLNDPGLTAVRFLPDPFSDTPGARMYRTGDAARWRADGQLEFVGRTDRQVKVRGFRIEPGEIEARLMEHPDVAGAVIEAQAGADGHKRLVAFVVPAGDGGVEPARLRSFIARSLPEHMVPNLITTIEHVPLTPNGKVDRSALPILREAPDTRPSRPPNTPTEELLVETWASVLGLDEVGIDANFFELGGDSILSIRVAAHVRKHGIRLSSADVFEAQTIADLAAVLDERSGEPHQSPIDSVPSEEAELTPIQRWFVNEYGPENHFNQSVRLRSSEPLNETLLQDAFEALVRHHDSLRIGLRRANGTWTQAVRPAPARDLVTVIDFEGPPDEREETIERECAALQRSLDVLDGTLIRALLVTDETGRDDLIVIAHHLAVDTISWEVLARHLEAAYRRLESGRSPSLPSETISYIDWSAALSAEAAADGIESAARQWKDIDQRRTTTRIARLHDDRGTEGQAGEAWAELSPTSTQNLLRRPIAACSVNIKTVLLTALARTLSDWTGRSQWVVDMEEHGRDALGSQVDLSESVGWFTALFPVSLSIDMADTVERQLRSIHEQLRDQPPGVTYGMVRYLRPDTAFEGISRSELSFNYHGQVAEGSEDGLLRRVGGGVGGDIAPGSRRPNCFEMNSLVEDGRLRTRLAYPSQWVAKDEMRNVVDRFIDHCRSLADAF